MPENTRKHGYSLRKCINAGYESTTVKVYFRIVCTFQFVYLLISALRAASLFLYL